MLDFFNMGDRSEFSVSRKRMEAEIRHTIEGFPPNQVLATPEDDLLNNIITSFTREVPILRIEDKFIESNGEVSIDVSHRFEYGFRADGMPRYVTGHRIVIGIPYTGDQHLFHLRASQYSTNPPAIAVENNHVYLSFADVKLEPERTKTMIEERVNDVVRQLDNLRRDVNAWNQRLPGYSRQILTERKQRLLAQNNVVASLGLPIKRRSDNNLTYVAPEVRRRINLAPLPVPTEAFKPEPELPMDEYENILEIIGRVAIVFERSPTTFSKLGEEALRDHILVQLNGHYESASGETFNASGKTDILIRSGEKNVFIAECKFWKGQQGYNDTIGQLLDYLTWRDTKSSVIIFNKNKNFTDVLKTIQESTPKHKNYKRHGKPGTETIFHYVFSHKNDPSREIYLAVMAFDIPTN